MKRAGMLLLMVALLMVVPPVFWELTGETAGFFNAHIVTYATMMVVILAVVTERGFSGQLLSWKELEAGNIYEVISAGGFRNRGDSKEHYAVLVEDTKGRRRWCEFSEMPPNIFLIEEVEGRRRALRYPGERATRTA